jgi:hypothetical protein
MLDDVFENYNLYELNQEIVWDGGTTNLDGYILQSNRLDEKSFADLVSKETWARLGKDLNKISKFALKLYNEKIIEEFDYHYLVTGEKGKW